MANIFATNFAVPGAGNVIQLVWKLTRCMKAAGWIYKASSNGTTKDTSGTATSDLWGGNADPTTDTYPSLDAPAAWWVGSGPQTLKIPITAAPTGSPIRGEIITQATSAAEGELVGYVFDPVGVTGWMVVLPHTGTFDNTHLITGSASAATFTPNGTIITYNREVMIGKIASSTLNGAIYYVCADASGESASLFSTLATSAGCTTSVWPAGGGTGNGFPNIAICLVGTGGAITGTGVVTGDASGSSASTHAQIAAVNATPTTSVSADGSFYLCYSTNTNANSSLSSGFVYTRLDDCEPGDVDPYLWAIANNFGNATFSRTAGTNSQFLFNGSTGTGGVSTFLNPGSGHAMTCIGYLARGLAGRDFASGYFPTGLAGNNPLAIVTSTGTTPIRTVNTPATTPPMIREHYMCYSNGEITSITAFKQYKGRTRWLAMAPLGTLLDTYDSNKWIVVAKAGNSVPAVLLGPYDGSSTPVN